MLKKNLGEIKNKSRGGIVYSSSWICSDNHRISSDPHTFAARPYAKLEARLCVCRPCFF